MLQSYSRDVIRIFITLKKKLQIVWTFSTSSDFRVSGSVTRCSGEKITNILVKIPKFVATVNKQVFKMAKCLHQSFIKLVILGKKLSPKASENHQNGEKLLNLLILVSGNTDSVTRFGNFFTIFVISEAFGDFFSQNHWWPVLPDLTIYCHLADFLNH